MRRASKIVQPTVPSTLDSWGLFNDSAMNGDGMPVAFGAQFRTGQVFTLFYSAGNINNRQFEVRGIVDGIPVVRWYSRKFDAWEYEVKDLFSLWLAHIEGYLYLTRIPMWERPEYIAGAAARLCGDGCDTNPYGHWTISSPEHPDKERSMIWDSGWSEAGKDLK